MRLFAKFPNKVAKNLRTLIYALSTPYQRLFRRLYRVKSCKKTGHRKAMSGQTMVLLWVD